MGPEAAAEQLGVRIYEDTKATALERDGVGVLVKTPLGDVRAARVALGTNAFKPLLRRMRHYIAPVYDYCMVTEPLTEAQLASIGWRNRQGLSDIPNQFHYYRLTEDNRILWGGYDAIYYWRGKVAHELESRPETWAKLSAHFFATFPQLDGVRFSHIWGGAIDTCSRFCVFWGTAMSGRVAYALGYTGLGVASTRFGAEVMLDLLDGRRIGGHRPPTSSRTSRCRSRPSRSASSASRRRGGRSTARTAAASATPGCARSTASASASTAEPPLERHVSRRRCQASPSRSSTPARRARRRRYGVDLYKSSPISWPAWTRSMSSMPPAVPSPRRPPRTVATPSRSLPNAPIRRPPPTSGTR